MRCPKRRLVARFRAREIIQPFQRDLPPTNGGERVGVRGACPQAQTRGPPPSSQPSPPLGEKEHAAANGTAKFFTALSRAMTTTESTVDTEHEMTEVQCRDDSL